MLPDFRTPMLWALCLGLAAALLTAGVERTRGASVRADAAKARQELAEYRGTVAESGRLAERAQRTQEQTWRTRVDGVIQDGQNQIAAQRAGADRARASQRRLLDEITAYRAAIRAAGAAPTVAEGGEATTDPLDLLADLFGRADARAGELAVIADQRGAAGTICQRHADATEP